MEVDPVELIEAVRRRPSLYDKTHTQYSNRHYINQQWADIGEEVGIDAAGARKKWTAFRDYFLKTLKTPGRKPWYLREHMLFLVPHVSMYKFGGPGILDTGLGQPGDDDACLETHEELASEKDVKIQRLESVDDSNDSAHDDDCASQLQVKGRQGRIIWRRRVQECPSSEESRVVWSREKTTDSHEVQLKLLEVMETLASRTPEPTRPEDEDSLFFRSLLPMIQRLSPVAKMECKGQIHSLILDFVKRTDGSENLST